MNNNLYKSISRQIFILFVLCITYSTSGNAQDPIFSQFYAAPIQVNPAFAGTNYAPRIAINYRNQYPGFANGESAFITYAASFDRFIEGMNSGIGLMVLSDDSGGGIYKTNKVSGIYSYRVEVKRDFYVKLGIEASYYQTRLNWDALIFGDQIDPIGGRFGPDGQPFLVTEEDRPDRLTRSYFDISTGFLAYNEYFYGGISVKHLNTPDESYLGINENLNNGLPARWTFHGGAQIKLREGNKRRPATFISPNAMIIKQGDFGQLNVGAYGNVGMIFGGIWYRHAFGNSDAAIFLLGVQKDIFKIGYSYDLTVSGLATNTAGTHEISIGINFESPKGQPYNDCFKMFR